MTATIRKTFAGLVAAGAVFSMSACGTSTDDIEDTLKSAFEEAGLSDDKAEAVAECMAPELDDRLSDDDKDALVDMDTDLLAEGRGDDLSDEGVDVLTEVGAKCFEEEDVDFGGGTSGN